MLISLASATLTVASCFSSYSGSPSSSSLQQLLLGFVPTKTKLIGYTMLKKILLEWGLARWMMMPRCDVSSRPVGSQCTTAFDESLSKASQM